MTPTSISQLRLVYKHILISLLLIVTYLGISFIIIKDLHIAFFLIPACLLIILLNLVWEIYSTNKVISCIFIAFIILLFYGNFLTNKDENLMRNMVTIFDFKQNNFRPLDKIKNSSLNGQFNIFFVETSMENEYFSPKQLCAIESAAFHNPNSNVIVYSLKAEVKDANFLSKYKNLYWRKFVPKEIFEDTPLMNWWLSGQLFKSVFMTAHLSDAARLALLWKFGGFYSDLDTIAIKSFEPLLQYSGAGFLNGKAPSLANGVMCFRARHSFLKLTMENFANDYNPKIWGHNGPTLLKKMMAQYCGIENPDDIYKLLILQNENLNQTLNTNSTEKKCNINIYPQEFFYPYNNHQLEYLFDKNSILNISAFINTFSVHFFGKVSAKYKVSLRDSNAYELFASSNCETVYAELKHRKFLFS